MYRCLLAGLTLVLVACGGGGGGGNGGGSGGGTTTGGGGTGGTGTGGGPTPSNSSFQFDTGIGGSGGIVGEIDAFGSIFINGLELNTDDSDFFIEGAGGFSQDDVREGYYVVVAGDITNSEAAEVFYRSNLKGPVSAVTVVDAPTGRYELTVLGQTVITSPSTRLRNVLAANIMPGDLLEISGPIDGGGRVLATYVELKSSLAEYKAIGAIAELDGNARTFDLGGLAVTYTGATLTDFDGASIANGQLVEVKMAPEGFTPPATATVTEVELLPVPSIKEGAQVEVEGYIDTFAAPTDFTVSGIPVTTNSSTTYEPPDTAAMLGLNVKVEVEGTANAAGRIVAESVEFKSDNAIRVEGPVRSVTTSNGTVGMVETELGIVFEIQASSELEDESSGSSGDFTLSELMPGDYIRARGFLANGKVIAVELERRNPETRARLRGAVTAFSEPTSTLEIQGVPVTELLGTTSYDGDPSASGRSNFYDQLQIGGSVEAEWDPFGSLEQPADQLTFED